MSKILRLPKKASMPKLTKPSLNYISDNDDSVLTKRSNFSEIPEMTPPSSPKMSQSRFTVRDSYGKVKEPSLIPIYDDESSYNDDVISRGHTESLRNSEISEMRMTNITSDITPQPERHYIIERRERLIEHLRAILEDDDESTLVDESNII